jgi:hypothetical protein
VRFCADSEQGDEPPERDFSRHEADEDGDKRVPLLRLDQCEGERKKMIKKRRNDIWILGQISRI